jgi:hypothetical protein
MNVRAVCLAVRPMEVVVTMRRFGLSECEQERVWELWGDGTSLRAVARKLGARPQYVRRLCDLDGWGQAGGAQALAALSVGA